jgi:hypothetical protein
VHVTEDVVVVLASRFLEHVAEFLYSNRYCVDLDRCRKCLLQRELSLGGEVVIDVPIRTILLGNMTSLPARESFLRNCRVHDFRLRR